MDDLDLIIAEKEFFRIEDNDIEFFLKERKRLEDNILEFKEDFDRKEDGKIKIIDFCKYIVGFSNTETGGFIFYGIKNNIKDPKVPFPDYIKGIEIENDIGELLQGWIRERIHRKVYVHIRLFNVVGKKILVVKIPPGVRKPYAYYDPPNKSYIYFKKTTERLDCLNLEEIESLYYETFIETAQKLQSVTSISKKENLSELENKIKSHQHFIIPKLENIEDYGYWCFYCYPSKNISIDENRFKETFLNFSKTYSESLNLSLSVETFQFGYSRGYFPRAIQKDIKSTSRVTCYYDGFIALDSQIDFLLYNNKFLNLNAFTYHIQRHLQLSKEILSGYCEEINCWLDFKNINNFSIPIWWGNVVHEKYFYQGIHNPIVKVIKLNEIQGRDKWNIIFPAVIEIIKEIARIFGLRELPQRYWDDNGYLDYAKGRV